MGAYYKFLWEIFNEIPFLVLIRPLRGKILITMGKTHDSKELKITAQIGAGFRNFAFSKIIIS